MNRQQSLVLYRSNPETIYLIPYYDGGVRAGFPSPAQDYADGTIDLNDVLIRNPASTFIVKVIGDSMSDEDILEGDLAIVDKSLDVIDGDLAVCYIYGEFTLKRVEFEKDIVWLVPSNPKYKKIKVTKDNELLIWGVVTSMVKRTRRRR